MSLTHFRTRTGETMPYDAPRPIYGDEKPEPTPEQTDRDEALAEDAHDRRREER